MRSLPIAIAAAVAGGVTLASQRLRRSMGARPAKIRRTAVSAAFDGRVFVNRTPATTLQTVDILEAIRQLRAKGDSGKPAAPIQLDTPDLPISAAELAATWLGHACVLLEIDGSRILADPVWSDRVSPTQITGPRRLHPVPMRIDELPAVDAIIISHDHYDHLDTATVDALVRTQSAQFVVPVGIGAHLRRWGVPESRIVELDWDADHRLGDVTITCTEARHFSGRGLRRNTTLWSSWVLAGPCHRVFFGGDTGYTPAFAGIGARYGPFQLTVLPIGAYSDLWPDIHMNPEEAVRANGDLGGQLLLPIHWATFDLALHRWAEPVERLIVAAKNSGAALALPRPGQRFDCADAIPEASWWVASQ